MTKKILIIHPEGNINNNPNLTGIVEILCENGFAAHIFSPRHEDIYQATPCDGAELVLVPKHGNPLLQGYVLLAGKPGDWAPEIIADIQEQLGPYSLVIGVDRGIIEASIIARALRIPCGLISYEILFEDETSAEFKHPEIEACRDLAFAICQDKLRGELLAEENHIDPGRIMHLPFAGRFQRRGIKNYYLYDQLGIERNKKLALLVGSVSEMCMVSYLIESAKNWPSDWVLVLHNRYGLNESTRRYYDRYQGQKNLYFSLSPEPDPNNLSPILHSADLGIALYKSHENSIWLGKNIQNVGMASGKISTYFQHGVPVMVNEIGELSDCVRQHELGIVIDDRQPAQLAITGRDLRRYRLNCYDFFNSRLNLNYTIVPVLHRILQTVNSLPN